MNFSLTDEQEMLRAAAADALSRVDTVAAARAALDGAPLPDVWALARVAGWPGLLVPEAHGGAGLGAFDAMLVLEQCGRRLTGAGLLGHLPATLLLSRAAASGDRRAAAALESLASGERRAAVAWGGRAQPVCAVSAEGRLRGAAEFIPDAAQADLLVVAVVRSEGAPTAALLDAHDPGVSLSPIVRYDASRPLAHVRLDQAPSHPLRVGAPELAEGWYVVQALLAADALGVAERMLELSVAYARDRYAFGRQIGSYQAIKHQIVEILRHAGTTRSLCFYAGFAAEARPRELALAASAARFAGEEAADYATRTCIAVHGGIGATWEHDAHLYWRRAQLSRLLLGGASAAADRVAKEIIARAQTTTTTELGAVA